MTDTETPIYRERLSPGLGVFVAIALVGPMVALSFTPVNALLALILGLAATIGVILLAIYGSPVVQVQSTTLSAGRAHIDVRWLDAPEAFFADDARHVRGAGLDARGWHLIRSGAEGIVRARNTDPADPASSWTISSRTPDRLAAAISYAQARSEQRA